MRSDVKTYLICYDIADPRRLQRVHRILSRVAVAIQYSVFWGPFSEREMERLWCELSGEIHDRKDDVRAYVVRPHTLVSLGTVKYRTAAAVFPEPFPTQR
ncbi:MAG: CRISPR-associated endonuclease Cas2 [Bryobacterales bacterium]|nr:CRISPR-associated endonuclease Cas2 [Bryobacterales bacterium]